MAEEQKKWRKEWQPTDDAGRPLGGMQVIEADSEEELWQKMIAKDVQQTRTIKKFIHTEKLISASGSDVQFDLPTPKELTDDEIFQLQIDLADTTKRGAAIKRIAASKVGADPDDIRRRLEESELQRINADVELFKALNPDYIANQKNHDAMIGYLGKHKMKLTRENLDLAFDELSSSAGLLDLVQKNEVVEGQEQESRIAPPAAPVTRARSVTTGLRPTQSSAVPDVKPQGPSIAEVRAMDSDEYARHMRDPKFRRHVDALFAPKR